MIGPPNCCKYDMIVKHYETLWIIPDTFMDWLTLIGIYNMSLMHPQPGRWYKVKFVAGCCSVFLAKTVGSQCAQTRKRTPNLEYIGAKIDRQLLPPNRHFEPISFQSFRILSHCFSNSSFRFPVGLLFLYLISFFNLGIHPVSFSIHPWACKTIS